ncbi:MAG TPA: stage II sporulation protein M [Anaerolineae bacterium]|nr:stage II sporulation protein M [Anaerolineae bacterium]
MAAITSTRTKLSWWGGVSILMRRELRDTFRDWRMVVPIVLLTLVFPIIMTLTAGIAQNFVVRYGTPLIAERLFPFLLMIVGFFPISFSLVIALETFVGERERKSLEPLLATPLSNGQLYLGKMLASMIPPLLAAYLGITVYLIGLLVFRGWSPPPILLLQVLILTTCEAIVMVSGAVVVSSQATSVRAANLLASFIIIPMALLIQAESVIMFLADYGVLWGVVLALIVVDLILVRMGLSLFNREELLGREIDQIHPIGIGRKFKLFWLTANPGEAAQRFSIKNMYHVHVPAAYRRVRSAVFSVIVVLIVSGIAGWIFVSRLHLPDDMLDQVREGFTQLGGHAFDASAFARILPDAANNPALAVFWNNIRSLLIGGGLSMFSFGSIGVVMLMVAVVPIALIAPVVGMAGLSPLTFILAYFVPHGVVELPAAILATAAGLRLGAALVHRTPKLTIGEGWLLALMDFIKLFVFVVFPLLVLAALMEVYGTPKIVCWIYSCQ